VITFLGNFLHSPWLLAAGLLVLAIPPIIHLLNRRRFDVVDWGAMQFLQISETTRRRLLIEEILLMLLRMGLLGVLVLALAGPFFDSSVATRLGGRSSRDVVLIIDGSASTLARGEGERAPADLAREWAMDFLDDLTPGDGVAVLLAREQPVPLVGELSVDHTRARGRLDDLPAPGGSCNWPEAVRHAAALLAASQKAEREIILLGDNQRFGWADGPTLFRWELLAANIRGGEQIRPRIWAVNLAAGRPARLPNWALAALGSNRPIVPVDREVTFQSEILLFGQQSYSPPHRIRLEVDGKPIRDLPPPGGQVGANLPLPKDGKVPFSFTHRFVRPGSHLVSVIIEPDPPEDARPHGYEVKDRVPGDNRQDFAVEVLDALPVLLVDGETSAAPPQHRGTDFLRDALSPARDRNPVVKARVVNLADFTPETLTTDPRPCVLILHDVPRLNAAQQDAITAFLGEGGGVLVTLGGRVEADVYNQQFHRGGEGWLPARLDGLDGDENKPAEAMRPDPATFTHPALELFRGIGVGGLGEATFLRWWRLAIPGKSAPGLVAGTLRNATLRTPFLVERTFAAGRVLLCAVPLDNSWGTNLVDLPSFVPLAHELVYYLAGARSADFNLKAGQPIRHRIEGGAGLEGYALRPPVGDERPLSSVPGEPDTYPAQLIRREREALLIYEGTLQAGVYRLRTPKKQTIHYVVPADGNESDLTPGDDEDRDRVAKLLGVQYADDRGTIFRGFSTGVQRQELWWILLVALLALLCLEVWMTRRMVMNR
jgi:hypothetical protein